MSVVHVGGRAFAAGLYWLERGGPGATARTARRLGRPWCVHHGERTGFAADDPAETLVPETLVPETLAPETLGPQTLGPRDPGGLPALALALLATIEGAFWMALVEGDADPSGRRRYALVKARGGTVLADGDEIFEDRAAALAAFERARPLGWSLFATPGLHGELGGAGADPRPGEVTALDPAALVEAADGAGESIALARAASRRPWLRPVAAVAGVAALAAIAVLWFERDALIAWLADPEMAAVAPAVRLDPEVAVAVDGAALIAACREALIAHPPFLPAWRIERIECAARFADPELAGLVPELAGRPALLVRWRLEDGHAEAVQRRVAERHLARWHAAAVAGARAWAVRRRSDPCCGSWTRLPATRRRRRSSICAGRWTGPSARAGPVWATPGAPAANGPCASTSTGRSAGSGRSRAASRAWRSPRFRAARTLVPAPAPGGWRQGRRRPRGSRPRG